MGITLAPNPMLSGGARQHDPETSHEAAALLDVNQLEAAVYACLWSHRPLYKTVVEIAALTGIDKWSISPRMRPMFRKGILDDPIVVARLNSAGNIRNQQAWRIKERNTDE